MKISVVTVTLNSRLHLAETIQSVLSQGYDDLEYLIVDGGSTDGTVDLIREQADRDPRIRWTSEPDAGIADAFNKGIRRASGDLIGIINADDRYLPGALAAVAAAYAAHPDCDVFHGDMVRYEGETPLFLLKPTPVETHIWREMPLNHPTTFVTRRAYERVGGFDRRFRVAMDYDLVLRLYRAGCRFWYLDQPLAAMRYGGASDSRFLDGLREVRRATVRAGYPPLRAWYWFLVKAAFGYAKLLLRRLGLTRLMRLHPRFRAPEQGRVA